MSFWSDPVTFIAQWMREVLLGWGVVEGWVQAISFAIGALVLVIAPLLVTIFLIVFERKFIGRVQDRPGPNRVGPFGIFQTMADMLKIFTKEYITPAGVDRVPYELAPILAVAAVIMVYAVVPLGSTMVGSPVNVGVLYLLAVGGLGELGIILAGLGSNNKFALLGAFRAMAQLLSYEVPLVVSLLVPVMFAGSMGLTDIVAAQDVWFLVLAPVPALLFFISSIAENGRAPFDLLEADSEIVAGFNIEYSGLKFGFFFVGDFLHSFTISLVFATLFMGGWRGPGAETYPILGLVYLVVKSMVCYLSILMLRASLPRLRIDQLLDYNWKELTPISLITLMVLAVVYKVTQTSGLWLQAGVLFVTNLVVWFGIQWVLTRRRRQRTRRAIVSHPRPVAMAEKVTSQPDAGGTGA